MSRFLLTIAAMAALGSSLPAPRRAFPLRPAHPDDEATPPTLPRKRSPSHKIPHNASRKSRRKRSKQ